MAALFIDPGALRHEMVLEAADRVPDGMGGFAEEWAEAAILFGMVEPAGAMARVGADQMLRTISHKITVRHRDGIESGMRLRRRERLFDIVTVHDPDETGRYLVLGAREAGR